MKGERARPAGVLTHPGGGAASPPVTHPRVSTTLSQGQISVFFYRQEIPKSHIRASTIVSSIDVRTATIQDSMYETS